ncbi:MAG: RNA pseudouridine synthase [Deltaproteobacteria bacterium]|nr:RNA pseudouridine synthase [Deltaproteobacteria bacterium]
MIELTRTPVTGSAMNPLPDPVAAEQLVVLLERPELIVIAKPAGMPSQPLRAGELGTAANAVAHRWPECITIGDDPREGGLVHRLDIGTSGPLIVARTPETYRALREAFGQSLVDKLYLAITDGRPVSRECDAPLVQRGKRVVVDHTDGLAAHTTFTVDRATATHALVRCAAQTGRMHQVRAHLAHVGAPITGDTLYGGAPLPGPKVEGPEFTPGPAIEGFFLHAASITFPLGTERIRIDAHAPDRFAAAIAACGL